MISLVDRNAKVSATDKQRAAVVAAGLSFLGTPFHHGARLKGVGVDCAQLLIAVYSSVGITPEIETEFYSPNWFLHESRERIIEIIRQFMVRTETPGAGDVALFRFGRSVSHGAIVTEWPVILHAYRGRAVCFDRADAEGSLFGRFDSAWTPKQWATLA